MADAILDELDAVRVFVAVAEKKSFRGAATSLGLPRSTVSRRIAELEAALDTRLFQRTTRRVNLTDAGETFLARVAPAIGAIADAGRAVVDARSEPRGLLRITSTPSMAEWIGPAMFDFMARYPDVRVEIDLTDRHVDLVGEGFDIAIRAGTLADSTLIARTLGHGRAGYFASPAYLKRHGTPTSIADLRAHEWVVFSGRRQQEPFMVKRRLVVNSLRVAVDAAIAGCGLAWLPETVVAGPLRRKALVPVLPDKWPQSAPLHLVYPSSRHLAPQVRAAIDVLLAKIVPLVGQSAPRRPIAPTRSKRDVARHGNHPVHGRKR